MNSQIIDNASITNSYVPHRSTNMLYIRIFNRITAIVAIVNGWKNILYVENGEDIK